MYSLSSSIHVTISISLPLYYSEIQAKSIARDEPLRRTAYSEEVRRD
jgi:hypothetical protein